MDHILKKHLGFITGLFLPSGIIVGVLVFVPLLGGIVLSFTDASPLNKAISFVGFENYAYAFEDEVFWGVIGNTLLIVITSIAISICIALGLALALNNRISCAPLYRAAIFQVWIVPWITVAVLWSWIFNFDYGMVNAGLKTFGIIDESLNWMADPALARIVIISGFAWRSIPLIMVISLAALQSIPKDCLEAAHVDGCNYLQRLRYIVLPLIRNALLIIGLLQSVRLFQEITLPWIVTQGGPGNATTTLAIYSYKVAFDQWDFGLSAAVSTSWMVAVLAFSIFYVRLLQRKGKS